MAVNLTDEQRLALETKGKVIVSASAGSGKTFVMINRLVNLIISGADVQDFIAATFTKKAAASMKEKLRDALIAVINESDATKRRRRNLKENSLLFRLRTYLRYIRSVHIFYGAIFTRRAFRIPLK